MTSLCYRCSATIAPDTVYCPQCGAPQVRYISQAQEQEDISAAFPGGARSHVEAAERATSIHWKLAIRIALAVSFVVGVLSALLAAASVLWVAVGAVIVLGMYRRKRPQALLNSRIGARIGVVVGMLAAFIALIGNAVLLVTQRFVLHQGSEIDVQLGTIVRQAAERATSMDPQAPVAAFTNFWLSAEGRTGLVLLTMAFLSVLIVLFAIAGGILGAQVYRSTRDRKVHS